MKLTEETTRPDVFLLKYDIDAMRERWLRTEHRYDCISKAQNNINIKTNICLLYTSPSPRDRTRSRMPSSA